jgi:hypothetical protein
VSPEEASDRLAIRTLIDAYAHCADRRDAEAQMALFTRDTHFVVYYTESGSEKPDLELHDRADLAPVFDDLNRYRATMHFNGQSTVELDGDTATGETYCLAHHVSVDGDSQTIFVAAIRYYDTFVKDDGAWLFAERKLYVDWTDTRALGSPAQPA